MQFFIDCRVKLVAIAERVIISDFAILLYYANIIKIDIFRYISKFRATILSIHFDFLLPRLRNIYVLKVTMGACHILDVIEP
mgnify:FL=1